MLEVGQKDEGDTGTALTLARAPACAPARAPALAPDLAPALAPALSPFSNSCPGQIPAWVRDVLYLTAVLNSCINPIIYGVYYFSGTPAPAPLTPLLLLLPREVLEPPHPQSQQSLLVHLF